MPTQDATSNSLQDPAERPGENSVGFRPRRISGEAMEGIDGAADEVGGAYVPLPAVAGAVAFTHFDTPSSEDNSVVILMVKESMSLLPSQSMVRIRSLSDAGDVDRVYLGVVTAGPFAEPDGLRADSPIVVATTVQGRILLPRYHGRAVVQILGEEHGDHLLPPRHRPRPNSPVFALDAGETAAILKVDGNIRLGLAIGQDEIEVRFPSDKKSVLPRHTGVIGTTGSGKSTTVSGLVDQFQRADIATVLIDVEGEYTEIDQATEDPQMLAALEQRGLKPHGVDELTVFHLHGRETSRESSDRTANFTLRFSELSPFAVMEILELPEAQQDRYLKAYDATRLVLRDLKIFPRGEREEALLRKLDDLEMGYPRMQLSHLLDIAQAIHHRLAKREIDDFRFFRPELERDKEKVFQRVNAAVKNTSHEFSWLGLIGKLHRLRRLHVFDHHASRPLQYRDLIRASHVSVIDLSDTDSAQINNLVIASLLRGIQKAQEKAAREAHVQGSPPTPVVVIIEEAHEFLSAERIRQMPNLFQQVARIAKRGRKRWLGLMFVTQLPQHLPNEVLALLNQHILHKVSDSGVVDRLRRSVGGITSGQWDVLPSLASGQALVSLSSMTRPLLVSIDPAPCKLRLVE